MTARRYKTGTQVFLIRNFDDTGTVRVTPCTVASWGGKQVHLLDNVRGGNHGHRLYTRHLGYAYSAHLLSVADTPDVTAAALKVAEGYIAYRRAQLMRALEVARTMQNPPVGYENSIRNDLAELHEPRVIIDGSDVKSGGAS